MFAKVFRASPAAIAITTTREGRVLDANESMLRLLGYDRDEAIGRTTRDLDIWADPLDRQRLLDDLAALSSVRDRECRMCTKDGRIITTLFAAEIVDIAGESCILTVLVDITGRKRVEAALQQEKAFTDAIIDSVPGTFYVLDEAGNLVRGNRMLSEVTGLTPDQIPGTPGLYSIHEEDRPAAKEKIVEAFDRGSAETECG